MMTFTKAERRQTKLKIALTGPSGSGKTYSSLLVATGLGGKIALIDTENKSASLYGKEFDFDTVNLEPPYTISKYVEAVKLAQALKYDVLIIDSISHAWAGEGGLLAKKEALDQRGGNSFGNWATISKEHEQFKALLLNAQLHVICTMRSKQDYILETNEKGKQAPRKVGLAPIQRDGMEYEFTTVFDIAMDHNAAISKDRTNLFDGQIFKLSKETGEKLIQWLTSAKPELKDVQEKENPKSSPNDLPYQSNVFCKACHAELILHHSNLGYSCPNSKDKKDEHTRFVVAKLKEFQSNRAAATTAEIAGKE